MQLSALLLAAAAALAAADEYPPPPPPSPVKEMSMACKLATGLKNNSHSMFKQRDFLEDILSSWGVLITGPPSPLDMLKPAGSGAGQYYQCITYPGYNFWQVAVKSDGGGGYDTREATVHKNLDFIEQVAGRCNLRPCGSEAPAASRQRL